jgi:apolipoprotein N-acyltransferase
MNPRTRALLQIGLLVGVILVLFLVFPKAFAFVEMAARELRYLWWLILLVALAAWLIWGLRKKPK